MPKNPSDGMGPNVFFLSNVRQFRALVAKRDVSKSSTIPESWQRNGHLCKHL